MAAADRRDPAAAGHGLLARPRHPVPDARKGAARGVAGHRHPRRGARHPLFRSINRTAP